MKTKSNVQDLSMEAIESFLKKNKVGILSLADGQAAYGIPLAYFYEAGTIYLTISRKGRKMAFIDKSRRVSFAVFELPEGFGAAGKTNWTSVVCDGVLENITAPDEITRTVRTGERCMGMPAGTWDKLLEMVLQNPGQSNFWKIGSATFGGRAVEDEKIEFEA
jgi:nitroimidazol reductase NimA-like FMN-containing flavoprotein (pyridoxamine 5'-phosphate oxidase superfamily)